MTSSTDERRAASSAPRGTSKGTRSSARVRLARRKWSMARCLAVAISQAPGLSGTPDSGHCWSAATRASCASSSARPTSRTIRVRPAMILADSILQTASNARCVSVAVTATDHTTFNPSAQAEARRDYFFADGRALLCFGREIFRPEHLADFGRGLPARPVFLVQFHEAQRPFDRLCFRLQLKNRIPADDFLGLGERPVDRGYLPPRKPDARAHRSWSQPAAIDH